MKAVFIPYNQALKEKVIEILDRLSIRGFSMWDEMQGRGNEKGEPHYGDHAWPSLNSSILTVIPDEKVEPLLKGLKELDQEKEFLGLHAFVWEIEKSI
jgi:hypothetical protein